MTPPRTALLVVALIPLALAGCGGANSSGVDPAATSAPVSAPSARYAPRTDLLVVTIPDLEPSHWPAARFPPPLSARLFPNTPDRDLATDLRKQIPKNVLDPTDTSLLPPAQADRIARLLDARFGTPIAPTVREPDWDALVASAVVRSERPDSDKPLPLGALLTAAQERLKSFKWDAWKADWAAATAAKALLKLDDATLARGSVVYRRWCLQCHGATGAGDPAQAVLGGPMPRDYRQGVFKYVTAFPPPELTNKGRGAGGKARRADLERTIRQGVDGTIMPAFPTLSEADLDDVVSYVIYLSVRGETEFATLAKVLKPTDDDPDFVGSEIDWLFIQNELWVLSNWGVAANHPIPVPAEPFATEPERIRSAVRGFKLYKADEFSCGKCHSNYGRAQNLKWDKWGTVVQPRDLTLGVYRGGRKGEDLYARIYGGINPSGMTAFHKNVTDAPAGTPDKIWDLVHFLQALGDPADRRRMNALDSDVKLEP